MKILHLLFLLLFGLITYSCGGDSENTEGSEENTEVALGDNDKSSDFECSKECKEKCEKNMCDEECSEHCKKKN